MNTPTGEGMDLNRWANLQSRRQHEEPHPNEGPSLLLGSLGLLLKAIAAVAIIVLLWMAMDDGSMSNAGAPNVKWAAPTVDEGL